MISPTDGARFGAALREQGIALATSSRNREWMVCRGTLAFLEALLASPDGTGTTDAATSDLAAEYSDGGKWRGAIPKRLAADRLIEKADVVLSCRPARHRGYVTLWRLRDRSAAEARCVELRAWLVANPATPTKPEPQPQTNPTTKTDTRQLMLPGVE